MDDNGKLGETGKLQSRGAPTPPPRGRARLREDPRRTARRSYAERTWPADCAFRLDAATIERTMSISFRRAAHRSMGSPAPSEPLSEQPIANAS
jgi:hypothetical protein